MTNDNFDGQALSEKLKKLNNSQQAIESLSQWCITHRKKARQIVHTWHELFKSSQREHCVCFLYLANDILQNSKRKGNDFVNEFWKVLPLALKHVYEKGDEYGKKAVTRLVDIWEERKVFGSRGHSLKDEMLLKDPPPLQVSNGKISNVIRIGKRDAHAVRIKVAVGAWPEKLLTAFQCVQDDLLNEESALKKCDEVFLSIGKLIEQKRGGEEEVEFLNQIREHEVSIKKCLGKLESVEEARGTLISHLKEALLDNEPKMECVRTKIQVGRKLIEEATSIQQRLLLPKPLSTPPSTTTPTTSTTPVACTSERAPHSNPSLQHPPTFAPPHTSDHHRTKAAAAAMAAKLAASTSSAQMLTSVLSSLVAEEAATKMETKQKSTPLSFPSAFHSPEKRQKLCKNEGAEAGATVAEVESTSQSQQPVKSTPPFAPLSSVMVPSLLQLPPVFPPLPAMGGTGPFGYGVNACRPPPPMVSHVQMGLPRPPHHHLLPTHQQQSEQQQQEQQQQQQKQPLPGTTGGYYQQPPGMGFYGLGQQPATPPVPRQ